jgi:hypothetical protein
VLITTLFRREVEVPLCTNEILFTAIKALDPVMFFTLIIRCRFPIYDEGFWGDCNSCFVNVGGQYTGSFDSILADKSGHRPVKYTDIITGAEKTVLQRSARLGRTDSMFQSDVLTTEPLLYFPESLKLRQSKLYVHCTVWLILI